MKKVLFSFGLLGLLLLSVRIFAQTTYTKNTSPSDLEVGANYLIVGHHDALVANFNQARPNSYVITATANPTEGGTVNMGGMANLLYDTFEEYAIGNKIASAAIANGHDWWTTWDNLPGSNEDGVVAYYDGTQCGHLTYGNDQILLLGNAVSGLYDLQFDVLVPNGKNGYFNVMHHFAGSQSSWAMECYLHMTNDGFNSTSAPGHGTLNAGSIGTCDLPCVYDEWMHFHIHIDIDNDVAQLYFNVVGQPEVMYAEWQWSLNLYGTDVIDGTIEAVNFYPPMTSQTSEFYLDNVRFSQFNERCLTANNDGHTFAEMNSKRDAVRTYDYYEYGNICTLIAMANEGYSFVNWTKNGTVVSTNNSYSFTVTEDATFVANFSALDDDPLTYSINADGVSVTVTGHVDGTAATGELVIPETKTIDGVTYTVTNIATSAFSYCNGFTGALIIPNSVVEIGGWAFINCSGFTSLTIGEGVTSIGVYAFKECHGLTTVNYNAINCTSDVIVFDQCENLTTLNLGNNVQNIPSSAFYNTNFQGALNLPESLVSIGFEAFAGCNGLTGDLVIPNSVTTIGNRAFSGCSGFTGLTLGESLVSIGEPSTYNYEGPFKNCSGFTGSLTIPNSVTFIKSGSFNNCSGFTSLTIGNSVTEIGGSAFYNCSGFTGSLTIPNSVTTIGESAFQSCSGFTGDLTIGNSVTSIEQWAFQGCNGFTGSLTIGNSVPTIGNGAFMDCSGFTGSLTIPNSVTEIGSSAFRNCSGFNSLTIGNSVTSIWNYAFYDCSGLAAINVLAETPPETSIYLVFFNVSNNIPVTVPCGTSGAYQNATGWSSFTNIQENCDPLTYSINDDGVSVTVTGHVDGSAASGPLIIPETKTIDGVTYTVTAIDGWAFSGCTGLTGNLVIPNTVTFIGNGAFSNCSGFTGSLTIPNSVTTISYRAFYCCSGFTGNLTIGESVTTIGEQAFSACTGFSGNLILGNSVTLIDYDAFFNCNGFTGTLTIPSSVNVIYDWAFGYCSGFTAIHSLSPVPPHTLENVFNSLDYDIPVTVPCDSRSMYQNAWGWNVFNNIQEDCSGMYAVSGTANPTEGGSVIFGTEGETLFADTFEEYEISNQIATEAIAAGNDWWSTWSGVSGGEEDGFVADYNNTHCGHLIYGNDQVLLLNRDSGVYDIEFDILVPEGKNAFFSLLHQFDEIVNEAVYCHLHMTNENYQNTLNPGHGSIRAGNFILTDIPCVFDAWMHFRFRVDIDADIARCYYTAPESEETLLCQWPWSWNSNTAAYTNSGLAAMDFWPPMDGATSEYYIDNFSLKQYEVGSTMMFGNHFASGSACTLTAVPNEGYSFINWTENGEEVSTESVYSFIVTEDADYVANFASDDLHWNVNIHQYPYNMSVTGIIQIFGEEQQTTDLEIGAFCGDECRGTQRLTYFPQVDRYLAFLTLYGDASDVMNFRLYDHSIGEELDLSCSSTISFVPDGFIGTAFDPYVFAFGNTMVEQVSNFAEGYNWWGTYIEQEGIDGLGMLEEGLVDNGVSIRSQASGYTDYYEDYGWYGSLSGINNESSYRVITSAPCTVAMTGGAAVPSEHPITLSQGWTWIGYVPSTAMSVDAAMAGVDATSGDKLKSQQGYSDYYEGYGWFGSLNTIVPGMGLMYYSTNSSPVTLTYPDSNRGGEVRANLTADDNHWKPNVHAYPDNMTVIAVVELDDVELNTEHYELAAFAANGECRGSVKLIFAEPLHRHVAFLTISGKDASELSFRLYDTETGKEYYDAEESLDFVADAIVGDARDLYVVHFRGTTGMDEFASNVKVYPNPVNRGERFSIGMNAKSKSPIHVEIINALGAVVSMETLTQTPASIVAPINAGVYTLRISCEEDTCYRKIIVR